jgi:predicted CoA-binding protein
VTPRTLIDDFLSAKRVAVVGVSRNPRDFNTGLLREFLRRGYDAVPVNPHASQIEGRPCFARIQDIQPPVEAALLLVKPEITHQVLEDCAAAGVRRVWMFRAAPAGTAEFCRQHDIGLIAGYCPHMFLPGAAWFHRFHGWLLKRTGAYPR